MDKKQRIDKFKDVFSEIDCPSKDEILGICCELTELLLKKNADYKDSAKQQPFLSNLTPLQALLVRKDDKLRRMSNLLQGAEENFEKLRDTVLDDAGYDVLITMLLDNGGKND